MDSAAQFFRAKQSEAGIDFTPCRKESVLQTMSAALSLH
jgi:hypothetical protein